MKRRQQATGRWVAGVVLLFTLTLYGCPSGGPDVRPTPPPASTSATEAQRALARARDVAGSEGPAAAVPVYEDVARRYPATRQADEARIALAVAALDGDDVDTAARWLAAVREQPPRDPAVATAWHRAQAWLESLRGAPGAAAPHLAAVVSRGEGTRAEREQLAEILLEEGKGEEAWDVLKPGEGSPSEPEGPGRLQEILHSRSDEELAVLSEAAVPGEEGAVTVRLEHAERLVDKGDVAEAEAVLGTIAEAPKTPDEEARATALAEILAARTTVVTTRVGVLLPLSGPFGSVGERARMAVELAHAHAPTGFELVVRDTAGTPEGAAAALTALVEEDHVVAALGPVGYRESDAAAIVAETLGLPLLPLSARPDLSDGRDYVFRMFLTREAQARQLARWVAGRPLPHGAAVLYPANGYGEELTTAFTEELARLGAPIAVTASYEPGTEDLSKAISALTGRARPGKSDLGPSEVGFDLLFVPDTARMVRRVAPYLKYARVRLKTSPGIDGVQLVGASSWNHPDIVDPAEGLTDNAVFTAAFVPDAEDTVVGSFLRAFQGAHGIRPTAFQAESYDTAALLFETLANASVTDRATARAALSATGNRVGVTGLWTVLPDGRTRRSAVLLTVDGDIIRPRRSEAEEASLREGL